MKKYFFLLLAAVYSFAAFAQTEGTRQLRAWYDGAIIWQREAALVDSLNFFIDTTTGDSGNTGGNEECGEIDENAQIFVGVVAFNQTITKLPITSDTDSAKTFITGLTNANDFTAFAYAASQGNKMFDASCLPAFDKIFMLNFSDGTDNYSSTLWYNDGRKPLVAQANVYDTARYDLSQRADLNSYALGFGDDSKFRTHVQKVVLGSGVYKNASTSADLQTTFNEIAQSIIASAKNVALKTTPIPGTKYVRFCFTASNGVQDTIYTQINGFPDTGYTLTITKAGKYARFDTPVTGTVDAESGKVLLPLNNLKFVYNGEELQNSYTIEVSYDDELYYEDVEDSSTAEGISKRIAVVLVLDCSKSMADAFTPMKNAAIDFIETLEKMDHETEIPNNPNTPNTGDNISVTANGVSFNMKRVQGGTFTMGATSEQGSDADSDESPTHQVTLSDYYIGETEVTQALWYAVMGYKPTSGGSQWSSSYGLGDNYPAYYISWDDCQSFITKLNTLTGKTFRMPTEAEWEYAARGGNKSKSYKYSGSNTIGDVAWYWGNCDGSSGNPYGSQPVGMKAANELGIYDMSGNLWEWCSDWYGSYSSSAQTNPTGPSSGSHRVLRGGSWNDSARYCRVSYRLSIDPSYRYSNIGLRLVLVP